MLTAESGSIQSPTRIGQSFRSSTKASRLTSVSSALELVVGKAIGRSCTAINPLSGISISYELINRGLTVVMLEAREVLSGETGRTSGHLAWDLDDGFTEIAAKHGAEATKKAFQSHQWASDHVGRIAKQLDIECEYRKLPGYDVSQYPKSDPKHEDDIKMLQQEVAKAKELGFQAEWRPGYAVRGWDGKIDQRDAAVFPDQATFHPTKYLIGVMKWLAEQPKFSCYTHSRASDVSEKGMKVLGLGSKKVEVTTEEGHIVTCKNAVEATCVPLQKLSVVAEMEYMRTYCIAVRIPKGSVEDCLLYDSADAYKYIRMTKCDDNDDYMVIGGCDHKVGQHPQEEREYDELERWVRERFTHAGGVDYKWSGQIYDPIDYMAMIGKNPGCDQIYIVTGDSGNGLTHGVLAGRLIADEITGAENEWASVYNPKRVGTFLKKAPQMLAHDLQINAQYRRFLQSDIHDIEDLKPGQGGVLNPTLGKPIACYKDENGKVTKVSAICPHLKGVVCWNSAEQSWDCPIHGSRFSKEGIQLNGPAFLNLNPVDDEAARLQKSAAKA